MDSLVRDLRYALRRLGQHKRASTLSIALLALGIGFATASYSVLRGVLLRGLPFPDEDRIATFTTGVALGWPTPVSDYEALRDRQRSFDELGAFRSFNTMVRREGRGTSGLTASYVTGNLFSLLGAEPLFGRNFVPDDEDPSAPAVAILSYAFWQARFSGEDDVIGQKVILNSEPMSVIGVMPPGFHFPVRQEVWAALRWQGRPWSQSAVHPIGRLHTNTSVEQARRELELLVEQIEAEDPREPPRDLHLVRYVEAVLSPQVQRSLRSMLMAALAVLLIAAFNCATLRLGEARARRRELAVRLSLGAGRGGLARLLVAESLVVVGLGATAGLVLAWALVALVAQPFLEGSILVSQFWIDVRVDPTTATFAVGLAFVAFVISGLLPTLAVSTRTGASPEAHSTGRGARGLLIPALLAVEVAMCFALLLGAGLLARSAFKLIDPKLGFDPRHLATAIVSAFSVQQEEPEAVRDINRRIQQSLAARPEIEAATFASGAPWWRGGPSAPVTTDTETPDDTQHLARARWFEVMPDFFDVVGLPLVLGRGLETSDQTLGAAVEPTAESTAPELVPAVVSQSFASRHFQGSPLDDTFQLLWRGQPRRFLVVGVVSDHGLDRLGYNTTEQTVYTPLSSERNGGIAILRGRSSTLGLEQALEDEIARVDPRAGSLDFITFDEARAHATWVERRLGQLFALFAVAAVALVAIGLYAVIVLSVHRRKREFGIRLAVGARPADVRLLVFGEASRHLLLGLAFGAAIAFAAARLVSGFLYQVSPWDPLVVLGALLLISTTTLAAALGPASLAARTDPASSLRQS